MNHINAKKQQFEKKNYVISIGRLLIDCYKYIIYITNDSIKLEIIYSWCT